MAAPYQVAAPSKPRPKPAFTVQKLEGKRVENIITFDAKGKRSVQSVEKEAGYLVRFPHKGHSIRVKTDDDLKRLGFDQTIPVLDDDGEVVFDMDNPLDIATDEVE